MFCLYLLAAGMQAPQDSLPAPKMQQLSAVTVQAQRPVVQPSAYGVTFNVESSPLTKGSNTLEVLQRAPGVVLDLQHNVLLLNGKSGAKVMINGKLLQLSTDQILAMLQNMGADAIEKIELLPTPPAQYDAAGNAGLINIVLKQNRKPGNSGGFTMSGGYGYREKVRASANIAHNQGNNLLSASYSYAHHRGYSQFNGQGNEIMPQYNTGLTTFDFLSRSTTQLESQSGALTWEHSFDPGTTAGLGVNYERDVRDVQSTNTGSYVIPVDSLLQLHAALQRSSVWQNTGAAAFFKNDHWNAGADYLGYRINSPLAVNSSFLNPDGTPAGDGKQYAPQQRGISNTTINVGVFTLDYTQALNANVRISAGVKGTYTQTNSHAGIESLENGSWQPREGSTAMRVGEGIGAAYTSAAIKLDSATRMDLGLRYEYAQTIITNRVTAKHLLTRQQSGLFPSILLSHYLAAHTELLASYTRRIGRPTYNDLSSFIEYNDPLSVFTGNPLLRPAITSNYKLGLNLGGYAFSILYSQDKNAIADGQLMEGPEKGVVYISPQNLRYQRALDLQATVPVKAAGWWQMNYSLVGGWHALQLDFLPQPAHQSYFTFTFNYTQTFLLPGAWSIALSGWYSSANYYGAMRILPYAAINAGARKVLPKGKGTLAFSVTNPVRLLQSRTDLGAVGIDAFRTHARVTGNPESTLYPVFRVSYSRSFGSHTNLRETNSAADEKSRVK